MNLGAYQTGTGYLQTTAISFAASFTRYQLQGSASSASTRRLSLSSSVITSVETHVSPRFLPHQKQTTELREPACVPTKAIYLYCEGAEFSG
jgi:hypothetical protein